MIPVRRVWHEGETISGVVRFRNAGSRRINVRNDWVMVNPRSGDGADPRAFDRRDLVPRAMRSAMTVSHGSHFGGRLDPGMDKEVRFSIVCDPLSGHSGFRMEPGKYELRFDHSRLSQEWPDLSLRTRPAAIEVRASTDPRFGERVVGLVAGEGRITVLREHGVLESIDAATGRRIVAVRIAGSWQESHFSGDAAFSPNGRMYAILKSSRGSGEWGNG